VKTQCASVQPRISYPKVGWLRQSLRTKLLCLIEIANVLQKCAREAVRFSLNRTEVMLRASLVLQDLFYALNSPNAIVRASKPIFST
jgi:hypothetical protein